MSSEQRGARKEIPSNNWYVVCVTEKVQLGVNLTPDEAEDLQTSHLNTPGFNKHLVEVRERIDTGGHRRPPFSG